MTLTIISAYYGNVNHMVDVTIKTQNLLAAFGISKEEFPIYIWPTTWGIPDPEQGVTKGFIVTYKYGNKVDASILTQSAVDGQTLNISILPYTGSIVINKATYGVEGTAIDVTESTANTMKYFQNLDIIEIGSRDFINNFCGGKNIAKGNSKGVFFIDFTDNTGNVKAVAVDGQTLNLNTVR